MGAVIRIIFGIFIVVGAWMVKGKAMPNLDAEDITLTLMGATVTPSSLNLITLAFSLVGVAMIVLGIVSLVKRR